MDASHNSQFEQPERVVEKAELARMLEKALDTLTEKEKSVVLFYYYEDLSLKEAGYLRYLNQEYRSYILKRFRR